MTKSVPRGRAVIADASSGLGAVYAHRLALRGHDLLLAAHDPARLERFTGWIRESSGRRVETIAADLTEATGIARLEDRVRQDGSLAMLVNNATGAIQFLSSPRIRHVEAMISLNNSGPARLAYAAAGAFPARSGTIINVASAAPRRTVRGAGTHDRVSAFLATLSRTLNAELRDRGLRAQAVLPHSSANSLWDLAGAAVDRLPREIVLVAEALVDQALAGLDAGDVVTRPTAPRIGDWRHFDTYPAGARSTGSSAQPLAGLA